MGKHANPRRVDISFSTAQTQLCKDRHTEAVSVDSWLYHQPLENCVVQGRASTDTCRGMTTWMYREKEWEMQSWQPSSSWFSSSTPWLPLPSGSVRCPWTPGVFLCFLLSYISSDSIWYLQTEFCIKIHSSILHVLIPSSLTYCFFKKWGLIPMNMLYTHSKTGMIDMKDNPVNMMPSN